ncbi:MAG TPA: CpaF family protein [Candidatus Dormibacteraeota bacterium]
MIDYGPLQPLLDDPSLSEIMVNGPDEVWVERDGVITRTETRFPDEATLLTFIDQVAAYVGRRVNSLDATLDARLPDGSRVNAVLPPLSLSGPIVTIRRFPKDAITAADLVSSGSATPACLDFLTACVVARRNIIISGRTGTGKTTLLNLLSAWIPPAERIITIEDSAELQLRQPHWVRLETRPPDMNGRHEASTRDLVRNSLRMRPDRIIVGEVRGGEAFDMLQAMNTGHDGSMSTVHANSARDGLSRLESLILLCGLDLPLRVARDQLASSLHLLVHLERSEAGVRRIAQVVEIVGREGEMVSTQDVFVTEGDRLVTTRVRPKALDAMVAVRHQLPAGLHQVFRDPRLLAA